MTSILFHQLLCKSAERFDGAGELLVFYSDVALGGGDVGVPEEFLDGADVFASGVSGGGEPVTKLVGGEIPAQELGDVFADVVWVAVSGESAGKIVAGCFALQVGAQGGVGWDVTEHLPFTADGDPAVVVVVGVEFGYFESSGPGVCAQEDHEGFFGGFGFV